MSEPSDPNQTKQRNYTLKLGTGMIVLAWLIFLGLLVVLFDNFLAQQRNPNKDVASFSNSDYREVVLLRNRAGHYVASGRINGYPVNFLLDTGATDVSIPMHIAEKISLKKGSAMRVITANGMIDVYATRLDRVELGNISLGNIRAGINPYMREDEVLLGMSFLKQLEMLQKDNTLTIKQYY